MALNSILVGKHIYKVLSEAESIKEIVDDRIFPIVCENGTKMPFIVFTRTGISTEYNKDGSTQDTVIFEINCVDTTYNKSCELANAVRNLLDNSRYTSEEIKISSMHLDNVKEAFIEDGYCQTLTFRFIIK